MHPPESSRIQRQRVIVSLIAIFASTAILFLKYAAFLVTASTALKSDALESIVNVVAGVFALFAVVLSGRPADRGHPYGHGKIEFFAAAFEGGLISLASFIILYEAVRALWQGLQPHNLSLGLYLNLGAGALNGFLGMGLVRAGHKLNSQALIADGRHILSDFQTTLGLVGGLLLVRWTGLTWIDPLLAIGVACLLIRTGYHLVRESSGALLDSEDPLLIQSVVDVVNGLEAPEIITIHELRAMRSGRYVHLDMHVVVPEFYEVGRAHDLVEDFGRRLIQTAGLEGECHTHTDPCHRIYCEQCEVTECPVRGKAFARKVALTPAIATATPPDI